MPERSGSDQLLIDTTDATIDETAARVDEGTSSRVSDAAIWSDDTDFDEQELVETDTTSDVIDAFETV